MKAAIIIIGSGLAAGGGYAGGKWVAGAYPTFLQVGTMQLGPFVAALAAGLIVGTVVYYAQK